MGKKYLPVEINQLPYKIYLDNLHKIYRVNKITIRSIPAYQKNIRRKESIETLTDL